MACPKIVVYPTSTDISVFDDMGEFYESSGGRYYVLQSQQYGTAGHLWRKSDDYCTTWTSAPTSGGPVANATDRLLGVKVERRGDVLHVMWHQYVISGYSYIYYNTFGMYDGSTEAGWGTRELAWDNNSVDGQAQPGFNVRSDGTVLLSVGMDYFKDMGSSYTRWGVIERSSGGTWGTTPTDVSGVGSTVTRCDNNNAIALGDDTLFMSYWSDMSGNKNSWVMVDDTNSGGTPVRYADNYSGASNGVGVVDDDGSTHAWLLPYAGYTGTPSTGYLQCSEYVKSGVSQGGTTLMTNSMFEAASQGWLGHGFFRDGSDIYWFGTWSNYTDSIVRNVVMVSNTVTGSGDRTWSTPTWQQYSTIKMFYQSSTIRAGGLGLIDSSGDMLLVARNNDTYQANIWVSADDTSSVYATHSVDFVTTYNSFGNWGAFPHASGRSSDASAPFQYGSHTYQLVQVDDDNGIHVSMWRCADTDDPMVQTATVGDVTLSEYTNPAESNEIQHVALWGGYSEETETPTATSNYTNGSYPPSNTLDGDTGTVYRSTGATDWHTAAQYLQYEFTSPVELGRIRVYQDTASRSVDTIAISGSSNGTDWVELELQVDPRTTFSIPGITTGYYHNFDFVPVTYKYWRVTEYDIVTVPYWYVAEVDFWNPVYSVTGGTFRLDYDGSTTGNLDWNISLAAMETAIEGLTGITAVSVTGSPGENYVIEFTNPALTDLDLLTVDDNSLTPFSIPVQVLSVEKGRSVGWTQLDGEKIFGWTGSSAGANEPKPSDIIVDGTTAHILVVSYNWSYTNSLCIHYYQFDLSTNTWTDAEDHQFYRGSVKGGEAWLAIRESDSKAVVLIETYYGSTYITGESTTLYHRTAADTWTSIALETWYDTDTDDILFPSALFSVGSLVYIAGDSQFHSDLGTYKSVVTRAFKADNSMSTAYYDVAHFTDKLCNFWLWEHFDDSGTERHILVTSTTGTAWNDKWDVWEGTGTGEDISLTIQSSDVMPYSGDGTVDGDWGENPLWLTYDADAGRWVGMNLRRPLYIGNLGDSGMSATWQNPGGTWDSTNIHYQELADNRNYTWHPGFNFTTRNSNRYVVWGNWYKQKYEPYGEHLFDARYVTHDIDFSMIGQPEVTHDVDFITFTLEHTIDHSVDFLAVDPLATPTIDYFVDFLAVTRIDTSHDADFILAARPEISHDIDFVLIAPTIVTITHDVDFMLIGEIGIATTMTITVGVAANESVELPLDVTGDNIDRKKHPTPRIIR